MSDYEQERVLCEDCGQNEAVCTVAVMMGKQVLHRKLCQACMAKTSMSIASGNVAQVLGALMAAARNAALNAAQQQEPEAAQEAANAPEEPELPQTGAKSLTCPDCGMTLEAYSKTKRLGCPTCCTTFRSVLTEIFRRDCPGAIHVGRRPIADEEAQSVRARREALQREMAGAVAREDFEAAARCRDELRRIDAQEGNSHA